MTTPNPPQSQAHPDDLLLPYLQDLLAPDQRSAVELHVAECPRCSDELEGLRETIGLIRDNRVLLCPSDFALYELVRYGTDPGGRVSAHLDTCAPCRQLADEFWTDQPREPMPDLLWAQVRERLPRSAVPQRERDTQDADTLGESWFSRISRLFRFPTLAAAAAAAILAGVILYPRGMPEEMIALSPVAWEQVARPKGLDHAPKRLAMVVVLKGFTERYSQARIDAIYRALAPSMDISERYQVLAPAQVRDSLRKARPSPDDTGKVLATLAQGLDVSTAAMIIIRQRAKVFDIEAQLLDAKSGSIQAHKSEARVPEDQLEHRVCAVVFGMLGVAETGATTEKKPQE